MDFVGKGYEEVQVQPKLSRILNNSKLGAAKSYIHANINKVWNIFETRRNTASKNESTKLGAWGLLEDHELHAFI